MNSYQSTANIDSFKTVTPSYSSLSTPLPNSNIPTSHPQPIQNQNIPNNIPQQFQNYFSSIKLITNPHLLHKQFLQEMREKVETTKTHLQQQILNLDDVLHQLEKDICQDLRIELTEKGKEILEKFEQNKGTFNEKEMIELFVSQQIFKNKLSVQSCIDSTKQSFSSNLSKIQQLNIKTLFPSYSQKLQTSQSLYKLGLAAQKSKLYSEALQHFLQALSLIPSNYMTNFHVGYDYHQLGKLDEALQNYYKSLSLNPNYFPTCSNIAIIYEERRELEKAIQWYGEAIMRNREDAMPLGCRGDCYFTLNRYEEALRDYEEALRIKPGVYEYKDKIRQIKRIMSKNK